MKLSRLRQILAGQCPLTFHKDALLARCSMLSPDEPDAEVFEFQEELVTVFNQRLGPDTAHVEPNCVFEFKNGYAVCFDALGMVTIGSNVRSRTSEPALAK